MTWKFGLGLRELGTGGPQGALGYIGITGGFPVSLRDYIGFV